MRSHLFLAAALVATGCGEREEGGAPPRAPTTAEPSPGPAPAPAEGRDARREERERMVDEQVAERGVGDEAVLAAMRRVPRHLFVPEDLRAAAYEDRPLAIGEDQTISQPFVVASMTEEAHVGPTSKVLEIGTGSGYQAAVLAEITPHVFSIEIKPRLAARAREALDAAGYSGVRTRTGDGYHGWPEEGPFDAIVVTAAAPHVPPPLVRQLKEGGRMLIPVGRAFETQDLTLVTKDESGKPRTKSLYAVRFVPLTGSLESDEGD